MARDVRSGSGAVVDLWAMAAELERQFAGYKQRLAERNGSAHDDAPAYDGTSGGVEEEEAEAGGGGGGDVRGRMYEAYVRRRDERLREGWRARMERKEAEVKALWAQLELGGRAGGGDPTTTDDGAAGDEHVQRKTERNDNDKRRRSDAALPPRSFSSSTTTTRNRTDVGRRRALLQEPPPSEPHAGGAKKDNRVRPAGDAETTTATPRPKTSSRRKNSVKGHGFAKTTGPKPPRSLSRRASSGGLEDLNKEVVLPNADAAAPVQSRSSERALHGETPKVSPLMPFVRGDSDSGAGAVNLRDASPDSDNCKVVDAVADGEHDAKNDDVKKRDDENIDASPDKLGNGNVTSGSDTEPNYVNINKDVAEEQAMSLPEPLTASDTKSEFCVKNNEENATDMPAPTDTIAAESTTTSAEEAPARESSDESSFSGRSGRSPPNNARPSYSSRDQSIERLLEADAVLRRKKREERAEKSAPKTPGSAGSRFSGTAPSPRETVRGFKRFLSFGKKNRGREVTVIDCTSPSVPSLADDDSASGGWQSAGWIKPRMGSSDAASDDTDHGYPVSPRACSLPSLVAASPAKSELAEIVPQEKSPKAHRSFFSFRSLNCGRG